MTDEEEEEENLFIKDFVIHNTYRKSLKKNIRKKCKPRKFVHRKIKSFIKHRSKGTDMHFLTSDLNFDDDAFNNLLVIVESVL